MEFLGAFTSGAATCSRRNLSICADQQQHEMFSYGSLEERIPADHPLRSMRAMVDEALRALDGRFNEIYQADGRKSIPPERLLRALLLQLLYSVRSERMLNFSPNYCRSRRDTRPAARRDANAPRFTRLRECWLVPLVLLKHHPGELSDLRDAALRLPARCGEPNAC